MHHQHNHCYSAPRGVAAAGLAGHHRRTAPRASTATPQAHSGTPSLLHHFGPHTGRSPALSTPSPRHSSTERPPAGTVAATLRSPRVQLFPEPGVVAALGPPLSRCGFALLPASAGKKRLLLWTVVPALFYLGMTVALQVSILSREIWTSSAGGRGGGRWPSSLCEEAAAELRCEGLLVLPPPFSSSGGNRTRPVGRGYGEHTLLQRPFPVPLPTTDVDPRRRARPNYGGIRYKSASASANAATPVATADATSFSSRVGFPFGRIVRDDDASRYHAERYDYLSYLDSRNKVKSKYEHYDDLDWPSPTGCRRAKTTYTTRPTCNAFHERPLGGTDRDFASTAHYLGRGYYRTSWSVLDLVENGVGTSDVVLKNQRYRPENEFDARQFAQIHVEALSMERTTASDRTTDIYGHCGTSILVERAYPIETTLISDYIFPDAVTVSGDVNGDVKPRNQLTPPQKLAVALAMAEGLAWLHGNYDGVIVNDDIQISQWLLGRDGKVKLNDFNKAVIMPWSDSNQSYCTFFSEYVHQYRSPEELRGDWPVDESADVFSFGQTLYTLLTGLVPFYERGSREAALKANKYGDAPYIDARYRNRSQIEGRLVEVMEPCYRYRPNDRATIFQVVAHLRETVQLYERQFPNATRIADVPLWDLKEYGTR